MKLFTNPNKHTVVITEQQMKAFKEVSEAIKVSTAEEPDATAHSTQKEFARFKKCPKCGAHMPFLMAIYDEHDKDDGRVIGHCDEDGNWEETEYQAFGLWQCPKCYHVEAESNMA